MQSFLIIVVVSETASVSWPCFAWVETVDENLANIWRLKIIIGKLAAPPCPSSFWRADRHQHVRAAAGHMQATNSCLNYGFVQLGLFRFGTAHRHYRASRVHVHDERCPHRLHRRIFRRYPGKPRRLLLRMYTPANCTTRPFPARLLVAGTRMPRTHRCNYPRRRSGSDHRVRI